MIELNPTIRRINAEWSQLAVNNGFVLDDISDFNPDDDFFGAKETREVNIKTTKEKIEPKLASALHWYFSKYFPNWEVEKDETDNLARIYIDLFLKYCPDFADTSLGRALIKFCDNYELEFRAMIETYRLLSTRKGIPPKKPKNKGKEAEKSNKQTKSAKATKVPTEPKVKKEESLTVGKEV